MMKAERLLLPPRKQKQKAKQKIEKKECQIEYMNENEAKEV